ncbi:hypothetical protein BELL_0636g00010 [Botrytis elliptica]|uniref:Uncharacterized protein n=1 Tax=Botrytis elliptica TaxID=278938 RepID=A0A4Z1JBC4_9HELO|nr:hypothetical protein BELL_0636g00010 [Botrytis elliptica]
MSDQPANPIDTRVRFSCLSMRSPPSPRELQRFFYCNKFHSNLNESRDVSSDKLRVFPWIIVLRLEPKELSGSYEIRYFTNNPDGEPDDFSQFREWKPQVDSEIVPQLLQLNGLSCSEKEWVWECTQEHEDGRFG